MKTLTIVTALSLAASSACALADSDFDFGQYRDSALLHHSQQLFGVNGPLTSASTNSVDCCDC